MATPINILKNDQSILKWFESATISMTESGYCYSLDLVLNSLELWGQFDPDQNNDDLAIKVLIGDQTYEFLCEERSVSSNINGTAFSVWGRTKQAYLDKPFSRTIKDTDETNHPWQTQDVLVEDLITYVLANYCDYSVTVDWNVENFLVYKDSFSVSERTPIEVISGLADVIGAKIICYPDGTLSIETYSVTEETAVETYNDFDHITALSEETKYSLGYNAVTIVGRGASTNSAQLQYEVQGEGGWVVGEARTVRVYYFHPSLAPTYATLGSVSCRALGFGTETVTEDILLTFGSGSCSKFDLEGESNVSGTITTPLELRSVSYQVRYKDFSVSQNSEDVEGHVLFYFSDKSASSLLTLSASNIEEDTDTAAEDGDAATVSEEEQAICNSVNMETEVTDENKILLKIYGNPSYVSSITDMFGTAINFTGSETTEKIEETILFSNGIGNISKPYHSQLSIRVLGSTVVTSSDVATGAKYSTTLTTHSAYEEEQFAAIVSYFTSYTEREISFPAKCSDFPETYPNLFWFVVTKCGDKSSLSISNPFPVEDSTDEEVCTALSFEASGTTFTVYGNYRNIERIYDMYDEDLTIPTTEEFETIKETITFSDGSGSLSKPFYSGMVALLSIPGFEITTKQYSTEVTINTKKPVTANVRYETVYVEGTINLSDDYFIHTGSFLGTGIYTGEPDSFQPTEYNLYLDTTCGETLSASTTLTTEEDVAEEEEEETTEVTYQDVTITVKDYTTDVAVENASIFVDGVYRGLTNADGELELSQLAVGDHTLRITATNYQNSEDDELSNDTFTVS